MKQLVYLVTMLTMFGEPLHAKWQGKDKTEQELRKEEEESILALLQKKEMTFDEVVKVYKKSERRKFKNLDLDLDKEIGKSVLCLAAYFGDGAVMNALLRKGLPINGRDKHGRTALMWAAFMGHYEIVTLLLERGADPTIEKVLKSPEKDSKLTALYYAYRAGDARSAFFIIEKLMAQDTTIRWKVLPWSVSGGAKYLSYPSNKQLMRLLIESPVSRVNIDEKNSEGDTALMLAVKQNERESKKEYTRENKIEMIKFLLSKGALVDLANKAGESPLSFALDHQDKELVYLFAVQAAKKDNNNKVKYGALTWAARYNHINILRILLERKECKVNAQDREDNTPLLWAVIEGHEVVARMLLQAGADVQLKNKYGYSPLYIAAQKGNKEILALLNRDANILNDTDEYGWNALITAARYGHLKTVKTILDVQGEDIEKFINIADGDCNTALHWAARFGHVEIVEVLLEHGAEVNRLNKYGRPPLYWAVRNKHAKVVRVLLDKGSYENKVDAELFMTYCKATNSIKNLFVGKGNK